MFRLEIGLGSRLHLGRSDASDRWLDLPLCVERAGDLIVDAIGRSQE